MIKKQSKKLRRYEADILRGVTIFSVMGMHTVATITYIDTNNTYLYIQYLIILLFRYNRQVFIFITAFILVYIYNKPDFNVREFFKKRIFSIIIPYIIWSIIYVFIFNRHATLWKYIYDILTGSAYYQLYYILLAIQLYLLLPFFIKILNKLKDKTVITLTIVSIIQVLIISYTYFYLKNIPDKSTLDNIILAIQDKFILFYIGYIFIGGFIALHINKFEREVKKYIKQIYIFFALSFIATILSYIIETKIFNQSIYYASSFMQPMIIIYSISIILLFFSITLNFINKTKDINNNKIIKFIFLVSESSFGLYLIHPIILDIISYLLYFLRFYIPGAILVILGWFITFLISLLIVVIALNIPYINFLVGKFKRKIDLFNA